MSLLYLLPMLLLYTNLAARYVANTTCVVERNHPPTCHPDRHEMERRNLPKQQVLPYAGSSCNLGRFFRSADAQGLNDMSGGGSVHLNRLCSKRSQPLAGAGWRWIIAATWRGTIQPHNSKFASLPGIATL